MFSHNANNKTGITDSKLGKNDNTESGDNRNNRKKQKINLKNSQVDNSTTSNTDNSTTTNTNNQNSENNQNFNANTIENNNYYSIKAREDSKNQQFLNVVTLKSNALKRIYEIRDTFINCEECRQIHKNDIAKMVKRMQKQQNLKNEFDTLYDQEWDYDIVPELPMTVDHWLQEKVKFFTQQKYFLDNYQAMRPGFYTPCKKHTNLGREWYMLDIQIKDYDNLLNK